MSERVSAIDFYFDFSSPYAYLAQARIDAAAAAVGRTARWRPFLLGAAMRLTGASPLTTIPLKGDYAMRDVARRARAAGLPFAPGTPFPFAALAPSRGFYVLEAEDPARARRWAQRMFVAFFAEGRTIDRTAAAMAAAGDWSVAEGIDPASLGAAIGGDAAKAALKTATDQAIDAGVFGAPYFIVDGEPFWGVDSMEDAMRWAACGGW